MQLRTKVIVFIILVSLLSVLCYQIYWMINFLNDQYKRLDAIVDTAMEHAEFKETALQVIDPVFVSYDSGVPKLDSAALPGDEEENRGNVVFVSDESNEAAIIVNDYQDSLKYKNFIVYNNLLREELKQLDVDIPYYLDYVDLSTNEILDHIPANKVDFNKSSYEKHTILLSGHESEAYNLYLYRPKWQIFKQVLPLFIISILMIGLVIIAYTYLLKIIWRQKTLDEIKSDFVSNMSHELKTPIATAYAAIESLQGLVTCDDLAKQDEYLSMSKNQLMHLSHLVEQILSVSIRKDMELKFETILVTEVFTYIKKQFMLFSQNDKQILFKVDVSPIDLQIDADKLHFTKIINNLVDNAVKYSGDKVEINLSAVKDADRVVIAVIDNGIGISPLSQPRIFDKFYRVPTGNVHNVKGYGLGLYYVKAAVTRHRWTINVKSTPNKGSCFEITI